MKNNMIVDVKLRPILETVDSVNALILGGEWRYKKQHELHTHTNAVRWGLTLRADTMKLLELLPWRHDTLVLTSLNEIFEENLPKMKELLKIILHDIGSKFLHELNAYDPYDFGGFENVSISYVVDCERDIDKAITFITYLSNVNITVPPLTMFNTFANLCQSLAIPVDSIVNSYIGEHTKSAAVNA